MKIPLTMANVLMVPRVALSAAFFNFDGDRMKDQVTAGPCITAKTNITANFVAQCWKKTFEE